MTLRGVAIFVGQVVEFIVLFFVGLIFTVILLTAGGCDDVTAAPSPTPQNVKTIPHPPTAHSELGAP